MITLALVVAAAMGQPGQPPQVQPVREVSLISETTGVAPEGTAYVALHMKLQRGWHIYWDGLNDSGLAPSLKWDLPAGVKVGEILWPAPHRYVSPGDILDHVYEGQVTLMAPLHVSEAVAVGSELQIKAKASWMVCDEMCLLGSEELSLTLPVVERPQASKEAALFKEARAIHPKPISEGDTVSLRWDGLTLHLSATGAASVSFYPGQDCAELVNILADGHAEGHALALRVEGEGEVKGVLDVRMSDGSRLVYQIREPVPA